MACVYGLGLEQWSLSFDIGADEVGLNQGVSSLGLSRYIHTTFSAVMIKQRWLEGFQSGDLSTERTGRNNFPMISSWVGASDDANLIGT